MCLTTLREARDRAPEPHSPTSRQSTEAKRRNRSSGPNRIERIVGLGHAELRRVEVPGGPELGGPLRHPVWDTRRILAVGEQVLVPGDAPAVLRRASASAPDTPEGSVASTPGLNRLEIEHVVPAVAEVVGVPEPITRLARSEERRVGTGGGGREWTPEPATRR